MSKILIISMLCIVVFLPAELVAQQWLADRDSNEGAGFKISDSLVLHLGVGAEGGFDTNAYRTNTDTEKSVRLRITSYLDIATMSKKRKSESHEDSDIPKSNVEFRFGFAGSYGHFFATSDGSSMRPLNGKNGIGIDSHANLIVYPKGKVSFLGDFVYFRALNPYKSNAPDFGAHQRLKPGIGVRIVPGGGTLSFEAGYRIDLSIFEEHSVGVQNNKLSHNLRFNTNWKVFPKTALVSKFEFAPLFYLNTGSYNSNSIPLRSWFGVEGLLTGKFGLVALAGYGLAKYKSGENFENVIGRLDLLFYITPVSNLRFGGERNFVDSYYANFYIKNEGHIAYQQLFGGVVLFSLKGALDFRQFAFYDTNWNLVDDWQADFSDRVDTYMTGIGMIEYRVTEWLAIHLSGKFAANITEFTRSRTTDEGPEEVSSQYKAFTAFAGVRGHY